MSAPVRPTTVDFHFDVLCPWAYQTSLWMRDVRDQLDLTVNWKFFSLEEVNRVEGKRHPWERDWSFGWSILRIGALLGRIDMKHLDDWYAVTGRALHVDGMKIHEPDVARLLLEEIGMDPGLVDESISDLTTNDEVKGFGVPTIFFPGVNGGAEQTIFGPVLINPPSGEAALRLWDTVCGWLEFPELYEIQRPKTNADQRLIGQTFKPYMEARDWVSINRGKVVAMEEDGFKVKGDAENAGQLKS
jgi:hypothetical protein